MADVPLVVIGEVGSRSPSALALKPARPTSSVSCTVKLRVLPCRASMTPDANSAASKVSLIEVAFVTVICGP